MVLTRRAADPHQRGHDADSGDERPWIGGEGVEPPAGESRQDGAQHADGLRDETQARGKLPGGHCLVQDREQHEIERGADRCEVHDAPPPDEIPDALLHGGASRRLLRRLERIALRSDDLRWPSPHRTSPVADRRVGVSAIDRAIERGLGIFVRRSPPRRARAVTTAAGGTSSSIFRGP